LRKIFRVICEFLNKGSFKANVCDQLGWPVPVNIHDFLFAPLFINSAGKLQNLNEDEVSTYYQIKKFGFDKTK